MKKLIATVLCLVSLCGCSGSPAPAVEETPATAEVELTGNVFLDADTKDYPSSGGGIVRVMTVEKSDALNASATDYADFIAKCLSVAPWEAYVLRFDDGTGVIYYGCDPSNATYGTVGYNGVLIEAIGIIVPNEDGSYSYKAFSE